MVNDKEILFGSVNGGFTGKRGLRDFSDELVVKYTNMKFDNGISEFTNLRLHHKIHNNLDDISNSSEEIKAIANDLKNKKGGVFILTGANASGKTTTINSIASYLSNDKYNIIEISDLTELNNNSISQMNYVENLKDSKFTTLKDALLSKPDLIIIDNIDNEKIAQKVFRSSKEGTAFITTIKSEGCERVINELEKYGVWKTILEDNLIAISSQKLVEDGDGAKKSDHFIASGETLKKIINGEKLEVTNSDLIQHMMNIDNSALQNEKEISSSIKVENIEVTNDYYKRSIPEMEI